MGEGSPLSVVSGPQSQGLVELSGRGIAAECGPHAFSYVGCIRGQSRVWVERDCLGGDDTRGVSR